MWWCWLLIFLQLFFPSPLKAEGEFLTDYQVDYTVRPDGTTRARLNVRLTNRLSNIYASEFSLSIGSTNLSEIRLETAAGPLTPKVGTGSKTTNITVVFPDPVLGKDKVQQFTLEFTSRDFARRLGNVWEISIPKLARASDLDHYQVTLTIPESFGRPAALTPAPDAVDRRGREAIYYFRSADLLQSGINATFGREQFYDFALTYHLNNPNFYFAETEIALPPDTVWQRVLYQTLTPRPLDVRVDPDGNWLAVYRLGAHSQLVVEATGSATLYLEPRQDYPAGINEGVNYLQAQPFWETGQPKIKALAAELKQPRQIYDYLVTHLIYDYGRLSGVPTRLGAANALDKTDSALCLEFTDLFIALARAAGIPARAVNGYAFTDNSSLRPLSLKQDVLHAWPEYYDRERQLWRPIDPTWGNTTGGVDFFTQTDLNRLAFVMQGQESAYPVPAGAYKTDNQPAKNVWVSFGQSLTPSPRLDFNWELPAESLAGVGLKGKIIISNTGNTALYRVPVRLESADFDSLLGQWELPALPPFASETVEFTLPATVWYRQSTETLTVISQFGQTSRSLTRLPAHRLIMSPLVMGLIGVGSAGLIVLKLIHARLVKANSAN